ncbi:hypothetical protein M0804_004030 [Polistes exclamans]|nr:hypothetical protein M0804_004030 [Polistes exclamans]
MTSNDDDFVNDDGNEGREQGSRRRRRRRRQRLNVNEEERTNFVLDPFLHLSHLFVGAYAPLTTTTTAPGLILAKRETPLVSVGRDGTRRDGTGRDGTVGPVADEDGATPPARDDANPDADADAATPTPKEEEPSGMVIRGMVESTKGMATTEFLDEDKIAVQGIRKHVGHIVGLRVLIVYVTKLTPLFSKVSNCLINDNK